ncbi:MAG TPA: MarR family transcriptional regulator [Alphaproteobacteria bacterium]
MADLKPGFNPLFLREEDLREGMELLFFAYRDFIEEADHVLARLGLGRAHHRALYFIGRHPGITVSELLRVLRVTKQSLSRVLADLAAREMVVHKPGLRDRRRRHLALTPKGMEIERELAERQRARLARAYREAGAEAVGGFRKVLSGMISEADRKLLVAGEPAAEPRVRRAGAS